MPSSACQTCALRSEEHTSELQSHDNLVCRLLREKKTRRRHRCGEARPFGGQVLAPEAGADRPVQGRVAKYNRPVAPAPADVLPDVFFFNDTATTEIYTLSLHDALPISGKQAAAAVGQGLLMQHYIDLFKEDRKSTRLNSSHTIISYAVFCLKKKKH